MIEQITNIKNINQRRLQCLVLNRRCKFEIKYQFEIKYLIMKENI